MELTFVVRRDQLSENTQVNWGELLEIFVDGFVNLFLSACLLLHQASVERAHELEQNLEVDCLHHVLDDPLVDFAADCLCLVRLGLVESLFLPLVEFQELALQILVFFGIM